jgi:hypothetical protein
MPVCPSCRNEIERGVDPCPYCDASLDWGQPASSPAPEHAPPAPPADEPPAPAADRPAVEPAAEEAAPEPAPEAGGRRLFVLLPAVLVFTCMCLCCVGLVGYRLLFAPPGSESIASRPASQERELEATETVEAEETPGTQTSPLAEPAAATAGAPSALPEYKVVVDSSQDNAVSQKILIGPQAATQESLDLLARHLDQTIPPDKRVEINIYDDQAAIELSSQTGLPPEQGQMLFAHWRATYTRDPAGGVNKLEIWASDHLGALAVIDYTQ